MDRVAQLKEWLTKEPLDNFLRHALALEYVKLEDDASARKIFEEILSTSPSYVPSYYHLGLLLIRVGEPEKAIEVFSTGMKKAKEADDKHAYSELQMMHDELIEDN